MAKTKEKVNVEQMARNIVASYGNDFSDKEYKQAMAYAVQWIPALIDAEQDAKNLDLSVEEYTEASIHNGFSDGDHLDYEAKDIIIEKPQEQEVEEVDLDSVKNALKRLLTNQNDMMKLLYDKHAEYNEKFFHGELSHPLITIDKLNNRTLGNYTHGEDEMGITNHIRFNRHFIALNTEERILETLYHEMIHQWQDEVLYLPKGETKARKIKYPKVEKTGNDKYTWTGEWLEIDQKKRPKDWHNRDFKEMATVNNLPAKGDKCYGNIAKMREPKSYNRKFICGCVASNGHRVTVWCTRKIHATCNICGLEYTEVPKGGKVIQVEQSHVEKEGQDAIEDAMTTKFKYFKKFTNREEKEAFIDDHDKTSGEPFTEMEQGVYQKNHNAYRDGFQYWVAYNTAEIDPEDVKTDELKEKDKEAKQAKKKAKEKDNVKPRTQKTAKILKKDEAKRSHNNPEDIIIMYKELGSVKAIAEYFNVTPPTITYQKKKHKIDFKKGAYEKDGELTIV